MKTELLSSSLMLKLAVNILITVLWRLISKYKLVGVQEVRWDGGDTEPAGK
jgi:hypothetical protein